MKITSPCVVTLTWELKDSLNNPIAQSDEASPYFYGSNDLLPKIEEALFEHTQGEQLDLYLEPSHTFGDYNSDLVFFESIDIFPTPIEPGMQFEGLPAGAKLDAPANVIYTVTEVYDDYVVVDGNHPLAGISLRLHLDIIDVRPATEKEIEQGGISTSMFEIPNLMPLAPTNKNIH